MPVLRWWIMPGSVKGRCHACPQTVSDLLNAILFTGGELSVCRGDRLAEVQVKKPYLTLSLTILYSQSVAALCLDFLKLGSIEKLYKNYDHYKKNNPKRTAQALVNKEVREQHPGSVSDDLLRKKKEWALKIYNLFSEIVVRISCRIFIYVSRNIILNTSSSFVSITGSFEVEDSTGMAGM
ncbi:unnamed protein product [Rhizophagus irregularis]|uniref:Uncharacterized protein n=1 Tax=Rhizophagus irregularis TaxID=588596 RepID=A0A915Z9N8_9GLOM|nr:unnamed protein product [Rhizophagus irregularis]